MLETLEVILNRLCKSVEKSRENEQQAVYDLSDIKDAKLAFDVVASCGVEAKFFPQDVFAKIYVEKSTLSAHEAQLQSALAGADMLSTIKQIVDSSPSAANYTLAYTQTPFGKQLTLQIPNEKNPGKQPVFEAKAQEGMRPVSLKKARKLAKKEAESEMLKGPSVARQALPKYLQTKEGQEDSLFKKLLLLITGRAFKSSAWFFFILLIFGVIFSLAVTLRAFLCPDFATVKERNPAYCPKIKSEAENALEQRSKPQ